jgi:hypothetical protein
MLVYALVSGETEKVVDFYPTMKEAQAALAECLADEPEWEDVLRVEPVEFETSTN